MSRHERSRFGELMQASSSCAPQYLPATAFGAYYSTGPGQSKEGVNMTPYLHALNPSPVPTSYSPFVPLPTDPLPQNSYPSLHPLNWRQINIHSPGPGLGIGTKHVRSVPEDAYSVSTERRDEPIFEYDGNDPDQSFKYVHAEAGYLTSSGLDNVESSPLHEHVVPFQPFDHLTKATGLNPGVQLPVSHPGSFHINQSLESSTALPVGRNTPKPGKRKRGHFACPKCTRDQKKCVFAPGVPICSRCLNSKNSPQRRICTRDNLAKAILFRDRIDPLMVPKFGHLSMLYPQILGFCGGDESPGPTKWIELTQCDYDGKLQLQVRPCLITPALRDSHPHYANEYQLANPKEAHVAILELLRGSFGSFVDKTIETSDEITKGVFTVAATIARGQPESLLAYVLRLCRACRMIEGGWKICGEETLGLKSRNGGIPLSEATVLDDQLATVMFDSVLQPLRVQVLQRLQEYIQKRQKKGWLISFLSVFALLFSCTLAMRHQRRFAKRHGASGRYSCPEVVNGIMSGARLLLIYFHAVKGSRAFDTDWNNAEKRIKLKEQLKKDVAMPDLTFEFLKRIGPRIKEKTHEFETLIKTQDFEKPYWFTGQVLLPSWRPFDIVIPE